MSFGAISKLLIIIWLLYFNVSGLFKRSQTFFCLLLLFMIAID